jgi:hypothetical protein
MPKLTTRKLYEGGILWMIGTRGHEGLTSTHKFKYNNLSIRIVLPKRIRIIQYTVQYIQKYPI